MSNFDSERLRIPEGFNFPTQQEFSNRRAARVDSLMLASATATLLNAAGVEVDRLENEYTRPITESRRRLLIGPSRDVEVGEEDVADVVLSGWELTRNIPPPGSYQWHTNYDILALDEDGKLVAIEYTSSIHFGSAYYRRNERFGGDIIGNDTPYPELGIKGIFTGYERRHREEDLVQQGLAGLVVPRGLHLGTILEDKYEELAYDSRQAKIGQLDLPI